MPRVIIPQNYTVLRRAAYEAAGVSIEALTVARAEADDGNPAEWDALRAKRRAIKALIPKRSKKEA